jgi:hypothetical protein
MEEAREVKRQRERGDALEAQLRRVRAALEETPENVDAVADELPACARTHCCSGGRCSWCRSYATRILTALRERCLGAAPTGDEGKEGERG